METQVKKPIFLCDVDGVIADFIGAALITASHVTGELYSRDQVDRWDMYKAIGLNEQDEKESYALLQKEGFCSGLRVLPGAESAVKILQKMTNLWFVTSPLPHSPTWAAEREEWLYKHFNVDRAKVIHTHDKSLIAGEILLDDRVKNLVDWTAPDGNRVPILWNTYWNEKESWDGSRFQTWEQVFQLIEDFSRNLTGVPSHKHSSK